MKIAAKFLSLCTVSLILSACVHGGDDPTDITSSPSFDTCWKNSMTEDEIRTSSKAMEASELLDPDEALRATVSGRFDRFVQCYLGPVAYPAQEDKKNEVRLLRHHILITALSEYAAYKVTGKVGDLTILKNANYDGIDADARDSLAAVAQTDNKVRNVSSVAPYGDTNARNRFKKLVQLNKYRPNVLKAYLNYLYADRVLETLSVVKEAGTPAAKRTVRGFKRLFNLISNVTGDGLKDTLTDIRNLALNYQVMKDFYAASHKDIFNYMTCIAIKEGAQQKDAVASPQIDTSKVAFNAATYDASNASCTKDLATSWAYWDEIYEMSCIKLGEVAGMNGKAICLPGKS